MANQLARQTEASRQAEEHNRALAAIVESSDDAIMSTALDKTILIWNAGATRLFGYTAEEAIGKSISIIVPADRQQEREALMTRMRRGERFTSVETVRVRKDGSRVDVSINYSQVRNDQGKIVAVSAISRDITGRKRAEESHREREQQMRLFMEATSDCLWNWDLITGNVVRSVSFNRVFGYSAQEMDSSITWWEERLHPDDRGKVLSTFQDTVASGGKACSYEYRFRRKDGTHAVIHDRAYIVRDAKGKPLRALGAMTDISERKRAEEELRNLSGRLMNVQDNERRRIARELHDSTAQKLASLSMNLGELADELTGGSAKVSKVLRDSLALVEGCSREIRTISYLLHPPLLEELGLTVALRSYVEGFKRRSGLRVKLDLPRGLKRLPAELELALFRVVQECLGNIHRHSGSKTASIRLRRKPMGVVLEVRDRGRGLRSRTPTQGEGKPDVPGVGIAGMTERLRQLAGHLEFNSGKRGTTVRATVPLPP